MVLRPGREGLHAPYDEIGGSSNPTGTDKQVQTGHRGHGDQRLLDDLRFSNLTDAQGNTLEVGIAPTPIGPSGKRASMFNGLADSVTTFSQQPENAAKWVKYMSGSECQQIIGQSGVVFPARPEGTELAIHYNNTERNLDVSAFTEQVTDKTTFLFTGDHQRRRHHRAAEPSDGRHLHRHRARHHAEQHQRPAQPAVRGGVGVTASPGRPIDSDLYSRTRTPTRRLRGRYTRPPGGTTMAPITFDHATRLYPGSSRPAVDALNLEIADGEFLVLVGPSGCGKSTSLRMLAGLEEVNGGAIRIGERDVTHIAPKDRDIAMVFQNYALYPHMSVADNMGFALKIARMDKAEIRTRVADAAKILDLTDYLDRKPKALSGGQRQRVAMGRAIVRQPQCFLMDEPLSNLDAKLRVQTRTQIAALQRRSRRDHRLRHPRPGRGHDHGRPGRPAQRRPAPAGRQPAQPLRPAGNIFVAGFIGSPAMNIVDVQLTEEGACVGDYTVPIPRRPRTAGRPGREPGHARVPAGVGRGGCQGGGFPFEVLVVEELGSDAYAYGALHLRPGRLRSRRQDVHRPRRRPPPPGQGRDHPPTDPGVRGARVQPRHRPAGGRRGRRHTSV